MLARKRKKRILPVDRPTRRNTMPNLTQRQIVRHPFVAGVAILILGPFILGFLLLFVVLFVVAAALDLVGGRK